MKSFKMFGNQSICPICGDLIESKGYNLYIKPYTDHNNVSLFNFDDSSASDDWWKTETTEEIEEITINIEAKICGNCAQLIPDALNEIRKKIRGLIPKD